MQVNRWTAANWRRKYCLAGGTAWMLGNAQRAVGAEAGTKPVRVAVIGCGSVSNSYLPVLAQSPHVQLISTCDRRPERAQAQADVFTFGSITQVSKINCMANLLIS